MLPPLRFQQQKMPVILGVIGKKVAKILISTLIILLMNSLMYSIQFLPHGWWKEEKSLVKYHYILRNKSSSVIDQEFSNVKGTNKSILNFTEFSDSFMLFIWLLFFGYGFIRCYGLLVNPGIW